MNSLFSSEAIRSEVRCCEYKYNLSVSRKFKKSCHYSTSRKPSYISMVQQNIVLISDCDTKRLENPVTRIIFSNMINYPNTCQKHFSKFLAYFLRQEHGYELCKT